MHIETLGFQATAPGSGGASASAFSGDSATLRNARDGTKAWLLDAWGNNQTTGYAQVVAPSMPDTQRGVRLNARTAPGGAGMPRAVLLPLEPLDTLTVTIAGSATAGDIEQAFATVLYEDTPGLAAQLLTAQDVKSRANHLTSVRLTLSLGTSGGWSGSEALDADSDLLQPSAKYAVLGATADMDMGAIGLAGPDWANVRIAIPANRRLGLDPASYLLDLAERTGLPAVPVLDAANRSSVLVTGAMDENGGSPNITLWLARLS